MGTPGVVLAEAEPAEVVTVASARVPMPIALAGPAASEPVVSRLPGRHRHNAPHAQLWRSPWAGGRVRGQGRKEPTLSDPTWLAKGATGTQTERKCRSQEGGKAGTGSGTERDLELGVGTQESGRCPRPAGCSPWHSSVQKPGPAQAVAVEVAATVP